MRIDPATLDPTSRFGQRVAAALARDGASRQARVPAGSPQACRNAPEEWHDEEALQRAVVGMIAREQRPGVLAFHVPNGGRRGKAEAGRLKAMGTLAGVPDLLVIVDGRVYGLELKTARGRPNPAQKALAERWRRAGCDYDIARSVGEARAILMRWGALRQA